VCHRRLVGGTRPREGEADSRTVLPQHRLKPEDGNCRNGTRRWQLSAGADDVRRFTDRALARLGSGLEPLRRVQAASVAAAARTSVNGLEAEGLAGTLFIIDFVYPFGASLPTRASEPSLVSVFGGHIARNER